jgi:hypothetical protein
MKLTNCISCIDKELARAKVQASIIMAEEKASYKSEEIGKSYSIFGNMRARKT